MRKYAVAITHLQYYPNISGGTERNHKTSVKKASDLTENGIPNFQNTLME
jgi:hypothetical protein